MFDKLLKTLQRPRPPAPAPPSPRPAPLPRPPPRGVGGQVTHFSFRFFACENCFLTLSISLKFVSFLILLINYNNPANFFILLANWLVSTITFLDGFVEFILFEANPSATVFFLLGLYAVKDSAKVE